MDSRSPQWKLKDVMPPKPRNMTGQLKITRGDSEVFSIFPGNSFVGRGRRVRGVNDNFLKKNIRIKSLNF